MTRGAFIFVLVALSWMTVARPAAATAIETGAETPSSTQATEHPKPHYEKLVATYEFLGLLNGRAGVQLEYLATSRDAFVLYPWYMTGVSHDLVTYGEDYLPVTQSHGGGLDAQYRRYFGSYSGGRGFFVAPGIEVQHFATSTTSICDANSLEYDDPEAHCPASSPVVEQSFTYVGASFDVGAQIVLPFGLVFASSIGAQYRSVVGGSLDESKTASGWSVSDGSGLRPRVRMSLGWAFL